MVESPIHLHCLISVVIPTYNSGKTLDRCLKSITDQHLAGACQIVLVDGGSTDGTLDIIKRYAKEFSSVKFVSEGDQGVYDAMNKGILLADGDWVLFLGADDQLYNNSVFENMSHVLKTTEDKFIYGNVMITGDAAWAENGRVYDGQFSLKKLFEKNICHQGIFYRRMIFDEVGNFNTRYIVCADWDLNFRCFAKTNATYVDQTISKFSGGGLSTTEASDKFKGESVFILRGYFSIGFFNPLFQTYEWVFYKHALIAFNRRQITLCLYYFILSFYHSKNKKVIISVTAGRIKKWIFSRNK